MYQFLIPSLFFSIHYIPDLHLIANFVNSSNAFKASESWTPICLPKFNDTGFLHAYVCFIATDVCLVLISTKQDSFYPLSNCKNLIVQVILSIYLSRLLSKISISLVSNLLVSYILYLIVLLIGFNEDGCFRRYYKGN